VGVDAFAGEIRVRHMLATRAAGRILNPKTARSWVIGGMTMGVGALYGRDGRRQKARLLRQSRSRRYEVPVHADIPHLEALFVEEVDPAISPVKAKALTSLA
jgi:xanthine dehydrogenase YagR molybdenum-binding subunit